MPSILAAILVNAVAVVAAILLYVHALMWVKNSLQGWVKYTAGLLCYVCMTIVIIFSFSYLVQSDVNMWIALIGWAVSIALGLWLYSRYDVRL